MQRLRPLACTLLFLSLTWATVARAGGVLEQVPHDALGLAVIRDLSQADAKAGRVLGALGSRLPGPLALLKSIAGLDAGLDLRREMMVTLLPSADNSRQFHLAVWLPVKNYDELVRSLDGDPQRRIAAVTLAGEDLLVVRQGDWAVVMDPDERDRLERLRDEIASPPQLAAWSQWVDTNDATVVVLPAGMRALWALAASEKLFDATGSAAPDEAGDDDLFGPVNRARHRGVGWPAVRQWIRSSLADAPDFARWAAEADGAGCGLRLDEEGDVLVGLRLAFSHDILPPATSEEAAKKVLAAPRLFDGGEFVVTGSGQVSPRLAVPAVAPYVRQQTNELAAQYGDKLDEKDVAKLSKLVELAVADIEAFTVLTRPGKGKEGVYTNNLLALRVGSAKRFLDRAAAALDFWNATVARTKQAHQLVFESKPIKVAEREGVEYSIDIGAAEGAPAIPEIKVAMEKLFGPGGKFRLQLVGVDDRTVLLAVATKAQIKQAIDTLGQVVRPATDEAELRDAAKLFSEKSDWQLFVSPHGFTEWMRRQMDAVLGPVIGGPVVPLFPASPPVGFAGGVAGRVVWTEIALPIDTIRSYGKYSRK